MCENHTRTTQENLDIGAAPFLAIGILWTLAGLLPLAIAAFQKEALSTMLPFAAYMLSLGIGTILVGFGIMKRWRYIWLPAIIICVLGLPNFPIGTLLFGWAIYALWKSRFGFYPFDRRQTQA